MTMSSPPASKRAAPTGLKGATDSEEKRIRCESLAGKIPPDPNLTEWTRRVRQSRTLELPQGSAGFLPQEHQQCQEHG